MMIKQSGNVAKSFLKKETLLLSLITFLIYASVYFYERGVAYALHIPFDFIIINITTISDDFISFYLGYLQTKVVIPSF
ncbi:hypothetical protein R2E44_005318 [Klebsiella pneumoniae]|mgnify:FL=1|jgi:hypothetical protein|nr:MULTISPECIES: hypothetical protein [Enterobacterales]EDQ6258864.1 hypothetical protein [Salmonella enterica subsp. enterica]EFI2254411.1 hypothetical protein [Escherichia coli]MDI0348408.1 hypothetical protein [Raoultella ornithinolytica]EIV5409424.1 hypothetical protein [Klebsiella pneumoniae]EKM5948622.1 hypothetical protein [Klebsiella pneumoniae]